MQKLEEVPRQPQDDSRHVRAQEERHEKRHEPRQDRDGRSLEGCSFRLTGRLFRRRPAETQVLLANGLTLINSDRGIAPRALRDIKAAVSAGRFTVDDPELALAVAGGALMGMATLICNQPDRDDGQTADKVTEDLLRIFGMSPKQAHKLCQRPLPELDAATTPGPAA